MKKIIKITVMICLSFVLMMPTVAVAAEKEYQPEWKDIVLSPEEFEEILSNNPNNKITPYATGLIESYSIAVGRGDTTNFVIVGSTLGVTGVVKCGFTQVLVQIKAPSSTDWSDYAVYNDLYKDANVYNLSKKLSVIIGYQYRVTCIHYAKKNILQTQKISNTSNTISL